MAFTDSEGRADRLRSRSEGTDPQPELNPGGRFDSRPDVVYG